MYCAALGRYLSIQSETVYSTLQDERHDLFEALSIFLKASAKGATQKNRPSGCFIVGASCDADSGVLPAEAQALVVEINAMGKDMLEQFFQSHAGPAPIARFNASWLAEYVLVLQTGLIMMAVRGMDYTSLEKTIDIAVSGLSRHLADS